MFNGGDILELHRLLEDPCAAGAFQMCLGKFIQVHSNTLSTRLSPPKTGETVSYSIYMEVS